MQGRLALIVASEAAQYGRLGFPRELAAELDHALTTGGGWLPALPNHGMVLLNRNAATVRAAIRDAFASAGRQNATLLLSFIGHGLTLGRIFYYLTTNTPNPAVDKHKRVPNEENAVDLIRVIDGQLGVTGLDGLIVLLDTCQSGTAATIAAHDWSDRMLNQSGRVEVLAATGAAQAYNGCFTRTILRAMRTGLPTAGEYLMATDLDPELQAHCRMQQPTRFALVSGRPIQTPDNGLWLVTNYARGRDVLTGRPDASTVDHLTRDPFVSDTVRRALHTINQYGAPRLRLVTGPAGCGKSAVLSMLVRPELSGVFGDATFPLHAAVFLTGTSTRTTVIAELALQLERGIERMQRANERNPARRVPPPHSPAPPQFPSELGALAAPLRHLSSTGIHPTVLIDGLDEPVEQAHRDGILELVRTLVTDPRCAPVRVIASADSAIAKQLTGPGIRRIPLRAPAAADIGAHLATLPSTPGTRGWPEPRISALFAALDPTVLTGGPAPWSIQPWTSHPGWLIGRLATDLADTLGDLGPGAGFDTLVTRALETGHTRADRALLDTALLTLLAAPPGATLPLEVFAATLPGPPRKTIRQRYAHARTLAVALGALIARRRAGTDDEHLGIAHKRFRTGLLAAIPDSRRRLRAAHASIAAALPHCGTAQAAQYREVAGIRHHLEAGDISGAQDTLRELTTNPRSPRSNELTRTWQPAIDQALPQPGATPADDPTRPRPDLPKQPARRWILLAAAVTVLLLGAWIAASYPADTSETTLTASAVESPTDSDENPQPTESSLPRGESPVPPATADTISPTRPATGPTSKPTTTTSKSTTTGDAACTSDSTQSVNFGNVGFRRSIPAIPSDVVIAWQSCLAVERVRIVGDAYGEFTFTNKSCPPPSGTRLCTIVVTFKATAVRDSWSVATLTISDIKGTQIVNVTMQGKVEYLGPA